MQSILAAEEDRVIPDSKQVKHFADFSLFYEWLSYLNIDNSFMHGSEWQSLMNVARDTQQQVIQKTIEGVEKGDTELIQKLRAIEQYLGESDEVEKADVILVLGSKDLGRVDKAVTLFNNGYGAMFVMSGRSRMDSNDEEAEARVFAKRAIDLGVDEDKIFVEDTSVTVASNVRHSLNLLDKKSITYKSLIILTAWFAERRAWAHAMKYTEKVKIIRINSDMDPSWRLAPGNWYKNELGIGVVFGEFLKMKMAESINTI